MKDPRGVGPSKGNQGTTRGNEKILLTSVGIEPTTFVPPFVFIILRGTTFIESANTSLPTLVSRVKAALSGAALLRSLSQASQYATLLPAVYPSTSSNLIAANVAPFMRLLQN